MMNPGVEQVLKLSREYNLIPVVKRLLADMETPIRIFQRYAGRDCAFLLESVEGGSRWARYSFIGTDPFMMIYGKKGEIVLERQGSKETMKGRLSGRAEAAASLYRSPKHEELPPFTGGAIGFFGYDLLQYYEKLLSACGG